MSKRPPITPAMKVAALLQAVWVQFGIHLNCRICDEPMKPEDAAKGDIHFDHVHGLVFGGPHSWQALRPTHKACNLKKAGQESKANWKGKRIRGETKTRPKRKIKSAGFNKSKRPMRESCAPRVKQLREE